MLVTYSSKDGMKVCIDLSFLNVLILVVFLAPESLRQEYGGEPFYNRQIIKQLERIDQFSGDPMKVVDAIYSALFSEAPLNRYLVGMGTWIFKLISQLYSPIADILIFLFTSI